VSTDRLDHGPDVDGPETAPKREHGIGLGEATRVWGLVALNSFGGPAGQIAVIHQFLVEDRRWFSEKRFLHSLNYCMLLPGPEAQQLASYFGWLLHGVRGGLIAGGLFILPGFLAIMVLSILYAGFGELAAVEAIFYGIKPAVMAIVAAAVVRIGSRALKNRTTYTVAAGAFVAIFFLDIPFPFIVAAAGILGYLGGRRWPDTFNVIRGHQADTDDGPARISDDAEPVKKPSTRRSIKVLAIGLTLWFAPIVALTIFAGRHSIWVEEGVFFSTAAVVTFGGAYSVLAYLAQQAVQTYGWLLPMRASRPSRCHTDSPTATATSTSGSASPRNDTSAWGMHLPFQERGELRLAVEPVGVAVVANATVEQHQHVVGERGAAGRGRG
jgi:chromate transporter